MELGDFGARMSEAQKKQMQNRLKDRLEKKYILNFNMQESTFLEEDKIDAISGATDSWGGYFSRGDLHKNIKENKLEKTGSSITEGIGTARITKNFEKALIDDAFQTNDSEALNLIFDLIENQKIILTKQ